MPDTTVPASVLAAREQLNGNHPARSMGAQTWNAFEQNAGEDVPCIINGLWPEGALGFIGAAPKAGKTWLGLDIAIAVATGTPVFGSFAVPRALPVLYVALEGHKAAIRTRIGCIARGHGVHPEDADALANLHLAYKPKGINLAQPDWAAALCEGALEIGARFVIVDVLRRAAQIKENDASSFMELVDLLNPISDAGIAIGMLHHFNKVNEQTSQRTPAERMAGSGAMFGAFDVGLFITKSENGARRLTIHTDIRDLPAPGKFLVSLQGAGSGEYGGFTYRDNLRLVMEDAPPERKPQKAPPHDIRDWILDHNGGAASPSEIRLQFDIGETALRQRRDELELLGVKYTGTGTNSRYLATPRFTERGAEPPNHHSSLDTPRTPRSDQRGVDEHTFPAHPAHPAFEQNAGSPEHPALDPYYVKGSERGVNSRSDEQTMREPERGVNLNDDTDHLYWKMMDAINDPEAKEHE